MPTFEYQALTATGSVASGNLEAANRADLVAKLQRMGYYPTDVQQIGTDEKGAREIRLPWSGRVKSSDVEFFSVQMSTLINAHIPLSQALAIVLEQITSPNMRRIVEKVREDVEQGASFYAALAIHPKVFNDLYVNMIRAGEEGGVLGVVLDRLATFSERQRLLKSSVISALFYPAILFVLSILAISTLMLLVIPKFTSMFTELGVDLPMPTRVLLGVTGVFSSYWWVLALILIAGGFALRRYSHTEQGQLHFDQFRLSMPLFGTIFRTLALTRFTHTLSTLLENDVPLLQSLRVVKGTIGNQVFYQAIENGEKEIERGANLARPLEESGIFPPLVIHMISIGEETAQIDDILGKLGNYYDMEVKKNVERLTTALGPIVILIMGVLIGFMAVAMILPIFEASTALG